MAADMLPLQPAQGGGKSPRSDHPTGAVAPDDDAESSTSTEVDVRPVSALSCDPSLTLSESLYADPEPEALIFLDWDDTVLPTTCLGALGLLHQERATAEPPADVAEQLERLAAAVSETLSKAKARGHVIIVTNASGGWVQTSCHKFLPSLEAALRGVEVVSARSLFEEFSFYAPTTWKCRAFAGQLKAFHADRPLKRGTRSVVSIGDSSHEREALLFATYGAQDCWSKALKLMDRPSLEMLLEQHKLLACCLDEVIDHEGVMDYEVAEYPGPGSVPRAITGDR